LSEGSAGLAAQIDAAFAAEQVGALPPLTREDIPASYEAIGSEWLTDVLCRNVPGAAVTGHRLGPADDGTNNRRRIFVDYNDVGKLAGLPASVFCKATQGLANRQMLGHSGGVLCEVTFWNHARNLIEIEAPIALHARFDPVSFGSIVVFEDLAGKAEFCEYDRPVDRAFAEQQLALLARLHGRFHGAPELSGALSVLPTWVERFNNLATFHLEESCEAGFAAAQEFVPPSLFRRADDIWPATIRSLEHLRGLPATLCHGDVHLKNWYVKNDGVVGLGDWGVTHIGHWARDLIYTLGTSLAVDDRRAWLDDLIRFYLDQAEQNGAPKVSFDEAMLRVRQALPTAFAFWTLTLKPSPEFPDMQPPETARLFVARLAAAMDDLDALSAV
jgi:hypothetical protein